MFTACAIFTTGNPILAKEHDKFEVHIPGHQHFLTRTIVQFHNSTTIVTFYYSSIPITFRMISDTAVY